MVSYAFIDCADFSNLNAVFETAASAYQDSRRLIEHHAPLMEVVAVTLAAFAPSRSMRVSTDGKHWELEVFLTNQTPVLLETLHTQLNGILTDCKVTYNYDGNHPDYPSSFERSYISSTVPAIVLTCYGLHNGRQFLLTLLLRVSPITQYFEITSFPKSGGEDGFYYIITPRSAQRRTSRSKE